MPLPTHTEIRDRFSNELNSILRFVDFLHSAIGLDRLGLNRINSTLRSVGLEQFKLPIGGLSTPISSTDLITIAPTLTAVEQELPAILKGYDDEFSRCDNFVQNDVSDAHPVDFEKWVDYVTTIVPAKYESGTLEHLKRELKKKIREERALKQLDEQELDSFVADAAELGLRFMNNHRVQDIYEAIEKIEHLKFLGAFSNPDAEINAYRQSFILLMTAFDAAVFDLTRAALRKNFFPFISYFGRDAKVDLEDVRDFSTFDEFIEFVSEAQLKKRYLKDILKLLGDLNVPLVGPKGQTSPHLIELVLRRNLHVHNRGIVDQFYLDQKKNVHNLRRDQAAVVDEPYWMKAVEMCQECVTNITDWIEKGAVVPMGPK